MKGSLCIALILAIIVLFPTIISARHIARPHSRHGHHHSAQSRVRNVMMEKHNFYREKGKPDTLQVVGSNLPDCSHACGSCSPCRLVMVSFICASVQEAESCPMAYKCMCKNKSYPIP